MPGRRLTALLATGNPGKARELGALLGADVRPLPGWDPPVEDGATFQDNALIKARAGRALAPDALVIADDSGLEVDALGGEPGVSSARFGGEGLDDAGRVALLLERLGDERARAARFVCVLAAILPDGEELVVRGALEGAIAAAPAGTHGFGYDPVFVPAGADRTLAEHRPAEKNAISHRARAAALLRDALAGRE